MRMTLLHSSDKHTPSCSFARSRAPRVPPGRTGKLLLSTRHRMRNTTTRWRWTSTSCGAAAGRPPPLTEEEQESRKTID